MRILGVDPGLRSMGWGIIESENGRMRHIANGTCTTTAGELAQRLVSLHAQLTDIVTQFQPETAAVEHTFVNKDGAGTLKLGQARAIAMLVPAQAGLTVGEYAPNQVKKTVVGVGHAGKEQVQHMIRMQLPGVQLAGPDAADALAVALCHAFYGGGATRYQAAVARASA
ncbi:MAG: crossover junction endodeoxyribonuclease RuvC [Pseudomonadota bacterium]